MRKPSILTAFPLLFLCLIGTTRAAQNSVAGDWAGGIQIKDKWFVTQAHFKKGEEGIKGTFDITDVWFLSARGLMVEQLGLMLLACAFRWQLS